MRVAAEAGCADVAQAAQTALGAARAAGRTQGHMMAAAAAMGSAFVATSVDGVLASLPSV
jgi:hypothetical protein